MNYVSRSELSAMLNAVQRLGRSFHTERFEDAAYGLLQLCDFYMLAGAERHIRGEGVSVTRDGEFLCILINTREPDPVSWARHNFVNFRNTSISHICETLETVRVAYFQDQQRRAA